MNMDIVITAAATIIGAGVGSTASLVLKRHYDNRDKKTVHDVAKQAIADSKLESILKEIQELTDSPRVSVWVFSNGGYFYTGTAMQHMSMISESVGPEFKSIKEKYQKVPIHLFSRNLTKLVQSPDGFFQEYNELQYNDALSKIHEESDIVSVGGFSILNKEKKLVGCLSVGFPTHRHLSEAEIEIIKAFLPAIFQEIDNR